MRGEFIRGDGLVIPNNLMTYGIQQIFQWALTGSGYALHMGLANCNPDPNLLIQSLNEPTIGVHGYDRQAVAQNGTDWLTQGLFNNEQYYETKEFVFTATGGPFDKAINRIALINHASATTGQLVVALSSPLPAALIIDTGTNLPSRTYKYRIYGR